MAKCTKCESDIKSNGYDIEELSLPKATCYVVSCKQCKTILGIVQEKQLKQPAFALCSQEFFGMIPNLTLGLAIQQRFKRQAVQKYGIKVLDSDNMVSYIYKQSVYTCRRQLSLGIGSYQSRRSNLFLYILISKLPTKNKKFKF